MTRFLLPWAINSIPLKAEDRSALEEKNIVPEGCSFSFQFGPPVRREA